MFHGIIFLQQQLSSDNPSSLPSWIVWLPLQFVNKMTSNFVSSVYHDNKGMPPYKDNIIPLKQPINQNKQVTE